MNKTPAIIVLGCSLLIASLAASGPMSVGAQANPAIATQSITLPAGSVFEIIADHNRADAQFAWVLNLDNTFVQASRETTFRTRLIKEGVYALQAELKDAKTQERLLLLLTIIVQPRTTQDDILPRTSSLVVGANPSLDSEGVMTIDPGRHVISITPNPNNVNPLGLDLDAQTDKDGDGVFDNDKQAEGSFFATKSTPIHVWLTRPIERNTITVFIADAPQRNFKMKMRSFAEAEKDRSSAAAEQVLRSEISASAFGKGSFAFGLKEGSVELPDEPLLLQWNFGDGSQSLLDRPVHAYAKSGRYEVAVKIRNLRNGEIVKEFASVLDVPEAAFASSESSQMSDNSASASSANDSSSDSSSAQSESSASSESSLSSTTDSSSSSQSSESRSSQPSDAAGGSSSILKTVGLLLLVGIMSIAVGFGGMYLLTMIRKRFSLADAVEAAEKKLVPSTTIAEIDTLAPLEIRDSEEEDESAEKEEQPTPRSSDEEEDEERPAEEAVPDWLKPKATTVDDGGSPKWLQAGLNSDAPVSAASQETQAGDAPMPDWLKPKATAEALIDAPSTQPAAPEVEQQVAVPDWLKPKTDTASSLPTAAALAEAAPAEIGANQPVVPDWLKPKAATQPIADAAPNTPTQAPSASQDQPAMPDWLKPRAQTPVAPTPSTPPSEQAAPSMSQTAAPAEQPVMPDWLKPKKSETSTVTEPAAEALPVATVLQDLSTNNAATEPSSSLITDDVPDWLKAGQADATSTSTASTPPEVKKTAAHIDGEPEWLATGLVQADKEGQTPTSAPPAELRDAPTAAQATTQNASAAQSQAVAGNEPKDWSTMTKEEKERERKRQKRRRYRENKKLRAPGEATGATNGDGENGAAEETTGEEEGDAVDDPVQFMISADSIAPQAPGSPADTTQKS